ncbi:MAG: imidazolonepropionase [Hydrocarboniphaga sp.]|uniref:imidazolonepropionase n=1 Tax=Hydrocarboniphaga sp. TaxID=2033016 RepID=UPI00260377F3|nr:imidazolonepropionase [Hydrocarboniphaga sp.]MDB5969045.1 imidazolonepropionase [Hydrocarboniphaga sp.]
MSGDAVWINARIATLAADAADGYGLIDDGAIAISGDRIAWIGTRRDLPADYRGVVEHDCGGAWITPGLIDCHTHLVYAGDRAAEFEQRLLGASYEDIARAGGGIQSTVKATRAASEDELLRQSAGRLAALIAEGLTTIEIKSGYGLDLASEMKILNTARRLARQHGIELRTTFLGAHALPPEFAGRADDYIAEVCEHMLPAIATAGLADAVDAFCETIAFTREQTARVFEAAQRFGLPVKLHADQLSDSGGAALAAQYGALSADHLECASEDSVRAMAQAGTVAVLLPGAYYFLRDTHLPPIALLREHRVPIAISTDCNPGTSPCTSLLLMLNMACTLFRLTPAEALAGVTRNAALALGLRDRGQLAVGMRADFALWDIGHPAELAYAFGANPCVGRIFGGKR